MTVFAATNSVLRDFDPDAGGLFGFHKGAPGADDGERLAVRGRDGAVFEELDERLNEVAEVDAALLTDDLPPEAYADPGFMQFLKTAAARN